MSRKQSPQHEAIRNAIHANESTIRRLRLLNDQLMDMLPATDVDAGVVQDMVLVDPRTGAGHVIKPAAKKKAVPPGGLMLLSGKKPTRRL